MGGTVMNDSITRAAWAVHDQELPPKAMEDLIRGIGCRPHQRTTLYGDAPPVRKAASFAAAPLTEPVNPRPALRTAPRARRRRLSAPALAATKRRLARDHERS
jgi:FO synthase